MDGRIVRSGGRPVRTADRSAIVFDVPPEAEAFSRWQKGEFMVVERQFAKLWRKMLGSFDLEDALRWFNLLGINAQTCKTLEDAKLISESLVDANGYSLDRLRFAFSLLNLNIPEQFFTRVFQRWGYAGFPSLKEFAPYATHVLSIETFFYAAAASNLISRKKASSKVDLAYLFYLPFCMVFVSSDHIHRPVSEFMSQKWV
jgi:hypothetical protein